MKHIALVAALAAAFTSPFAMAQQASPFEGPSVSLNADLSGTTAEVRGPGLDVKVGDQSRNLRVQGMYGFAMSNAVILNVGVGIGIEDYNLGNSGALRGNLRDTYSYFVQPGMHINPTTMLFGTLSYHRARGRLDGGGVGVDGNKDFEGFGLGFGLRSMLNKELYLQVEASQVQYNKQTMLNAEFRPAVSTASFGVGYKF